MADLSLWRGKISKIENIPLKDGQFIIGAMPDNTAAIFADLKNDNDELVRVALDATELIRRIVELETKFSILDKSVSTGTLLSPLVTHENEEITTNTGETIHAYLELLTSHDKADLLSEIQSAKNEVIENTNEMFESAISIASNDSTTKSNESLNNAKSYADNILNTAKEYTDSQTSDVYLSINE